MTLQAEPVVPIEQKIHRIHHHHFHVHHLLDHHHLRIHNQTIHSQSLTLSEHVHIEQHDHSTTTSSSLSSFNEQHVKTTHDDDINNNLCIQNLIRQYNHQQKQLVQNRSLTHVIAPQQQPQLQQQNEHEHHNCNNQQRNQDVVFISGRQSIRSAQRTQIQFFLISAFAYILSPIDLIPEVMFGIFGILDDILFLFMCLFCVAIILMYPLFREVRRTLLDKIGLQRKQDILANKRF